MEYCIRSIEDILGAPPVTSHLPEIIEEHRRFFLDWSPSDGGDNRQAVVYRFGPTVKEPDIATRWADFEARYRERKRLDRFWLATLSDAIVEPRRLCVMTNSAIVRETVRPIPDLAKVFRDVADSDIRRAALSPGATFATSVEFAPDHVVDEAFLLGSGLYKNYYNWTLRYASRLPIFAAMPRDMQLVTPRLTEHVRSTLAFHGIRRRRIVQAKQPILVRKLHVCSPSVLGRHELSPHLIIGLRNHSRVTSKEGARGRRLFIPRVNVKIRHVLNQAAAIGALARQGFECFDCGAYSVEEQAAAFDSADIIVGVHGAGLANIVYAKHGTTVVEVIPEGYNAGVTSYRSLADHFNLRYLPLFAREVRSPPDGNRCNSDIEIDIAELEEVVAAWTADA